MQGTKWNGSYFANKGTSRSEGRGMFSVGNLVAFETSSFCSPDGRSSGGGCNLIEAPYFLQNEIVLEEYDRTTRSQRFGSGKYDKQSVVELEDVFSHRHYGSIWSMNYICSILTTDQSQLPDGCIEKFRIEEVRENAGSFLHVYELNEKATKACKVARSFEEAIQLILADNSAREAVAEDAVAKNYRGVELTFGITASGWYAPKASFGERSVQRQHEHDHTRRNHYTLVIMPCVPNGSYQFYAGGTPVSLTLSKGRHPSISCMTRTSVGNSQNWSYNRVQEIRFEKNWFFLNGNDVWERTCETIDYDKQEQVKARKKKFEEAMEAAKKLHKTEVIELALKQTGSVISILIALSNSDVKSEDAMRAIRLTSDGRVLENLLALVQAGSDPWRAGRVAKKAHAWAYIKNAFPEVVFTGCFSEAGDALEIYSKNWTGTSKNEKEEETLLGNRLRKALTGEEE